MRVAFLSMNFPPEVNALAGRTYRHARHWAENGGEVEVVTDVPLFPEGEVYGDCEDSYWYVRHRVGVLRIKRRSYPILAGRTVTR